MTTLSIVLGACAAIGLCELANAGPATQYKVQDGRCVAFTSDGKVTNYIPDPDKCGTVARYDWDNGSCHAYDKNGDSLGIYFGGEDKCRKSNPAIQYKVHTIGCFGFTTDGKRTGDSFSPDKCGTIARYDWMDGFCVAYDKNGDSLGVHINGESNCHKSNPAVQYKVHSLGCFGFTTDGKRTDAIVSPDKCGTVVRYDWMDGFCVAYDKNGDSLGVHINGESNCRKSNPAIQYKVQGLMCSGFTPDGKKTADVVSPDKCGTVVRYDWNLGYCHGYDKRGDSLGVHIGGEEYCRRNLKAPPVAVCKELGDLREAKQALEDRAKALRSEGNDLLRKSRNKKEYLAAAELKRLYRVYDKQAKKVAQDIVLAQRDCKKLSVKEASSKVESGSRQLKHVRHSGDAEKNQDTGLRARHAK